MVTFAGKFICGTVMELQCRVVLIPWVKKNSVINCSKGKAYCSSFPVRYIPKKFSKTKELQTSSPPMKGSEGKEMPNVVDRNVLIAEHTSSPPMKGSVGEEMPNVVVGNVLIAEQTPSPPMKGIEDKEMPNVVDPNVLGAEQTSSPPIKGSEDKEIPNVVDPNVLRAEQTSSSPVKGSGDKEMCNLVDLNALRAEFSNGGKSLQRSFVFDDKSQNKNQNQNQRPNNLIFNKESEMEEDIDHGWGVEDDEFMEEPVEAVQELGINQGKHAHKQLAFEAGKTKQNVETMAVELLATRAFTAVALRKKLLGKRFPHDIVDAVITDFQSRGLINDCLYAETFSRSRWSSSTWGPRRIKQALFEKGVSEVDAEKAIKLVFKEGESGGDHESRLGLSKLSMDHLLVQASKQWMRGRDVPSETRKSRIIRWLQYRGFNWGVINLVLKKLESEYPP